LNQCSRCGQEDHFWKRCSATSPFIASAQLSRKRNPTDAGLTAKLVPKARRIEAAPTPAVKQVVADLRGSPPLDLNILEVDTNMDD